MSDALIFSLVFGGLVVLRIIAAAVLFTWILPRGVRCPNCDAVTLRMENGIWSRLIPWLRKSWCFECEWEGMLRVVRDQDFPDMANSFSHSGQLPLSSKKSSK
jgi:hypothetical protein